MIIIPAIDLYQGKVVRLTKGDPARSKIYSDDPLAMARRWESEGSGFLHLVDLSAALGEGDNLKIIKEIVKTLNIKTEVGGGIRDLDKAKELILAGVERIIVGTRSLDEDFLDALLKTLGQDRVAVGVDVLGSCLAVEGWKKKTDLKDSDFLSSLQSRGVKWIIYTDISRDGTLQGANYKKISSLAEFKGMNIIFSGGVSSAYDLEKIKENAPFLWGVIVGKALYEGRISLSNLPSE